MADTIIEGSKFNANQNTIMYTSPKACAQAPGTKSINILNKASKSVLRLSTPLMLTWGAQDYINEKNGTKKTTMNLQFPNADFYDAEADAFLENLKGFENQIKNDAITHSKEWFGKVKNAIQLEENYNEMLHYPKDKNTGMPNYSQKPTLRVKIPEWEGEWKVEIYDEEGEKLFPLPGSDKTPHDFLKKASQVACIIQFAGIWFANGKFSLCWKLVQAVVQKPKDQIQGCMIKLKKTDKEKIKTQQNVEEQEEHHQEDATIVEDSDDEQPEDIEAEPEEEEEDSDEEESTPTPTPSLTPSTQSTLVIPLSPSPSLSQSTILPTQTQTQTPGQPSFTQSSLTAVPSQVVESVATKKRIVSKKK
jgi:hypothetical protein